MPRKNSLTVCPACGRRDPFRPYCPASFLAGDERTILECPDCRLSVLWPLPGARELSAYYHRGYYDFNRSNEEGSGRVWARKLRRLQERGRFLDVGCATGFFIHGIRQGCAWEVHGVETGREAAVFARRKMGLDVKSVPLEKARYPGGYFDVIHLSNVVEHVPDPAGFMTETARILKPGGRVFLTIPNGLIDRLGYLDHYRRTGKAGASKDGHLYFFGPRALEAVARASGLRIEQAGSSGLKRTLRTMGFWPRRRGWEGAYSGIRPAASRSIEDSIQAGHPRPDLYYWFRNEVLGRLRWPGLAPWAYDFNIQLRK